MFECSTIRPSTTFVNEIVPPSSPVRHSTRAIGTTAISPSKNCTNAWESKVQLHDIFQQFNNAFNNTHHFQYGLLIAALFYTYIQSFTTLNQVAKYTIPYPHPSQCLNCRLNPSLSRALYVNKVPLLH